ncbi:DUF4476 domain-containing protein [Pedobacter sp. SYP-B3415]|uniref:DUF4476 domain-containing protein n=1 Tax=Pedobacter sp. SYP-B3415 TaxID=2496641 RepID=UPI00101C3666|nr:DUF4476 domain-containing protein [Pedobacter sp. SYP-B3415]
MKIKFITALVLLLLPFFVRSQYRSDYSEVFIAVQDPGELTISANGERMSSSKGRFRFFDVGNSVALTISQANRPVIRRNVSVPAGVRLILTLLPSGELRPQDQLSIFRNNQYALDNWNAYVNYNTGIVPGRPERGEGPGRGQHLSSRDLEILVSGVKAKGFDKEKRQVAEASLKNVWLNTEQLAQVLKVFSFSEQRLALIKSVYPRLTDKQNAHSLESFLSFSSERENLLNFIRNSP